MLKTADKTRDKRNIALKEIKKKIMDQKEGDIFISNIEINFITCNFTKCHG